MYLAVCKFAKGIVSSSNIFILVQRFLRCYALVYGGFSSVSINDATPLSIFVIRDHDTKKTKNLACFFFFLEGSDSCITLRQCFPPMICFDKFDRMTQYILRPQMLEQTLTFKLCQTLYWSSRTDFGRISEYRSQVYQ